MELIIASHNTHKVQELREGLKIIAPHIQVLSLFDFPAFQKNEVIQNGSFEENALQKAVKAALALNKICIADDSGIVVPALGKGGIALQRRHEGARDSAIKQTKALLQELKGLEGMERQAYLECSLAIAAPNGEKKAVTQRCEGFLAEEERGKITFEFDTLFIKHDYNKTLGELSQSVRSRISHRRKALEKLMPVIEYFCSQP